MYIAFHISIELRIQNLLGSPPPATNVLYFTNDVGRDPSINYFFSSVPQSNAALCCDGVFISCFYDS